MPIYEYEHMGKPCGLGFRFELMQPIQDNPIELCPECKRRVRKLISFTNISTPKSDRELRDMGFTKLVKRDDGVYENVTAKEKKGKLAL